MKCLLQGVSNLIEKDTGTEDNLYDIQNMSFGRVKKKGFGLCGLSGVQRT